MPEVINVGEYVRCINVPNKGVFSEGGIYISTYEKNALGAYDEIYERVLFDIDLFTNYFEYIEEEFYLDFYKKNKTDKIWWTKEIHTIGEFLFSFDKKKIYNLYADYPENLTPEEKEIFDKENPFWANYFRN